MGGKLAMHFFILYLCAQKREAAHARQLVQAPLRSLNRSIALENARCGKRAKNLA
jgi:hypothetical protein